MKVDSKSAANVSAVGKNLVELQRMQTSATKKLASELEREAPPSTIVSLTAESVKLSNRGRAG